MQQTISEKNIYFKLLDLIRKKMPCALTTITKTKGSTPQKPGSSAIFDKRGIVAGTIGGGVTELKVEQIAQKSLEGNDSGYYSFDLGHDISNDSEAICGGGMDILLDVHPQKHIKIFEDLCDSCVARIPGILVTFIQMSYDSVTLIERKWVTELNFKKYAKDYASDIRRKIEKMLNNPLSDEFDELRLSEKGKKIIVLFETVVPREQLIIAGAGHIGKALSHLAKMVDFEVIVWDDREAYAKKDNLPDADTILCGNLEKIHEKLKIDQSTFVVIVTRGHKNDAEALKTFINLPAAYIGMMGSKRKILQVREMFLEKGWASPEQWDQVYAPVGLDIHSKTVQEIALSVAAQLVQVRNKKQSNND